MTYTKQALRRLRRRIGRAIHRHRMQHRMTLCKLALQSQLSITMLDRYELGKGEMALEALFRIACALNVPVLALIAGIEESAI